MISKSEPKKKLAISTALFLGLLSIALATSLMEKNPFYIQTQPEPIEAVLSNLDDLFPDAGTANLGKSN